MVQTGSGVRRSVVARSLGRSGAAQTGAIELDQKGQQDVFRNRLSVPRSLAVGCRFGVRGVPRPQPDLSIPQRNVVRGQPRNVVAEPFLVTNFVGLAQILGLEDSRRVYDRSRG
jgi:hypothetical protein